MLLKKKIQSQARYHGNEFAKVLSVPIIAVLMIVSHIGVLIISSQESLFPGYEAMMTIVTTSAQIIAGLYGITLAGYTFFLSRIDALAASDCTLDYVTACIKNRFQYLIWYITGNVLLAMLVSILLMCCPMPESPNWGFLYRLICNAFILSVVFSIGLILYYSILVIDPNCIEKEAAKLKRKIGGRFAVPGNAVEFVSLYDRIEQRCNALLPENVLSQLHENKGKRFELTLELLEEQHPQLRPLINDLTRIHRYYACVVNCSPFSVSKEMCLLAGRALEFLEQIGSKPIVLKERH